MEILNYFDNIDMEDELEASDIRDLINEIQAFYQKCFSAGINISIIDDIIIKKIKEEAAEIAKAMNRLQSDYSDEDDVSVMYAFSSNPIGTVLPFLEILKKANTDIDTAYEQMHNEKESLTCKGNWNDNVDPRFEQQQGNFDTLFAELREV